MKIYPGENTITNVKDTLASYIPLSLITDTGNTAVIANIEFDKSFLQTPLSQKVYPYQLFDNDNIYLFDRNNKPVDAQDFLKRNGNKFYFEPKKSLEFVPRNFTYKLLLLKNDSYKNSVDYNIRIGAYSLELAEELIGISQASVSPINVKFNNKGTMPSSYINMSYVDTDFIFMDKSNFEDLDKDIVEEFLNSHTNIWITCDTWPGLIKEDKDIREVKLVDDNNIYKDFTVGGIDYYIDTVIDLIDFPKTEYTYINVFDGKCPILILKKEDKGFIVISRADILNNSSDNIKLVYEVIVKLYLNSYFETEERESIIADKNIDYYVKTGMKFGKCHPDISFPRILAQDKYNTGINFDIVRAVINNDENDNTVLYSGIDQSNNIRFKSNIIVDPEKDDNFSSVLTASDTIIYFNYDDNDLRIIEEWPSIYFKDGILTINPFKSSSKRICLDKQIKINLSNFGKYVLYYDYKDDTFNTVDYFKYVESSTTVLICKIMLESDQSNLSIKDIRAYGGGEDSKELNYDMIDTGSIKGRPYRLGSTLIIRLPERYRKHKDNLMAEIKKHISSADYPILIFE